MNINLMAKQSITINALAPKVWETLINPELIKQYLIGSEVVTDWKVGSPVIYKGNYQGKTFEDKGTVVKLHSAPSDENGFLQRNDGSPRKIMATSNRRFSRYDEVISLLFRS